MPLAGRPPEVRSRSSGVRIPINNRCLFFYSSSRSCSPLRKGVAVRPDDSMGRTGLANPRTEGIMAASPCWPLQVLRACGRRCSCLTLTGGVLAYAQMKSRLFLLCAVAFATFLASGCYTSLDGRVKPGMPMAKDTIENRYERPADQVMNAAEEVLRRNGTLNHKDTVARTLQAMVDRNTVWIKVEEVEAKVSRVAVQARKPGGFKNIDLASELATQIGIVLATAR